MTTFVDMYHPLIPSTAGSPVHVSPQAVDDYEARGWLEVDPQSPPVVVAPYLTQAAGDSRYVPVWRGATPVLAGQVFMAPDGQQIQRIADGTTRATYDVTEQALWSLPLRAAYVAADAAALRATANAEAAAAVARLQNLFLGPAAGLFATRSGTTYSLLRGLGSGRYSKFDLVQESGNVGGYPLHQQQACAVAVALLSVDETAGTPAGTWTPGNNTAVYGSRNLADAVTTSGSATMTSATGNFTAADVSAGVTGAGIQASTLISAVNSPTSVTLSKTATATATGVAVAIAGTYRYGTANTATYTWTSPAGSTRLGLRISAFANGAYGKVSIDGDATAATLLPSAQDEVTAGRLASTALVANGGTLNPTDRLVNTYSASNVWDASVLLADGLTAAAHTVVYTATGYAPTASAGTRAYLSGFMSGTAATAPTDAGASLVTLYALNSAINSAWEYAIDCLPAGGTTHTFVGNVHGSEVEDSFTLTVDGAAVTLADGQTASASREAVFTRTSHLLHPDTGTTVVATSTVQYRIDRLGLAVTPDLTFQVATTLYTLYTMMPLNGASVATGVPMDRAGALAATSTYTHTGSGLKRGQAKSAAAWLWNSTGKVGALMYLPDVYGFTEGWAHSDSGYCEIEDRPPASNYGISKVYLAWVHPASSPVAVAAGYRKTWTTRYLLGYFTGGAEASLAAA